MGPQTPTDEPEEGFKQVNEVMKHAELLLSLHNSPKTKTSLAQELDVSTQTIYRKCRRLTARGLVHKKASKYILTAIGTLQAHACRRYGSVLCTIDQLSQELNQKTVDHLPPLEFFATATVQKATRCAPEKPIQTLNTHLEEADFVDLLAPTVGASTINTLAAHHAHDQSLLILAEDMYTELSSDLSGEFLDIGSLEPLFLQTSDCEIPYTLAITDDETLLLGTHGDNGALTATLVSQSPHVIDWGSTVIELYHQSEE